MEQALIQPHEEAAVLTRSVEGVLRKLIRFLIGRMSLARLIEMIRLIFVEEAEIQLRAENPLKNVTMSKLALLTGLDTRTLGKIRGSREYGRPLHGDSAYLRSLNPALQVIDTWMSDPRYFDESKARPRELALVGPGPSFESLMKVAYSARGMTSATVLDQLIKNRIVIREKNLLRLEQQSLVPGVAEETGVAMNLGFGAVSSLIGTVVHNISALQSGEPSFLQRGSWTYSLPLGRRDEFRARLRELLEHTDDLAKRLMEPFEQAVSKEELLTAGVSLFYFEESA